MDDFSHYLTLTSGSKAESWMEFQLYLVSDSSGLVTASQSHEIHLEA